MTDTKKHRPASRARYAAAHPSLTVHFTLEVYHRLVALREATGLSLNQLVRAALDSLEEHIATILERGSQQGRVEGRKAGYAEGWRAGYAKAKATFRLTYPCTGCTELIEIRVGEQDADFVRTVLVREGWAHETCIDKPPIAAPPDAVVLLPLPRR